jgi:hypothetical protein
MFQHNGINKFKEELIKFVVVDGSKFGDFNMMYHKGWIVQKLLSFKFFFLIQPPFMLYMLSDDIKFIHILQEKSQDWK